MNYIIFYCVSNTMPRNHELFQKDWDTSTSRGLLCAWLMALTGVANNIFRKPQQTVMCLRSKTAGLRLATTELLILPPRPPSTPRRAGGLEEQKGDVTAPAH